MEETRNDVLIDKNNMDLVLPNWVYTAEPIEVVRQLISDGISHMEHELHVILGHSYADAKAMNDLVIAAEGYTFKLNNVIWISKKDLSMRESMYGACIIKLMDMYSVTDTWSYSEIKNCLENAVSEIDDEMISNIIDRVRLIFFLRNVQGCLRTTFSEDPKIDDSGKRMSYGEGKAVREPSDGKGRFDLITPFGLERLAKWYEIGAKKYSDRNWEKGIPFSRYIDSAMRHMIKFIMGRYDEDHLAAAVWNLMAIMHHQALDETDLDDLPHYITRRNIKE